MTHQKGFTLIELMVVIAVIGILAAVALVSLTGLQRSARDATRKSNLSDYATALGRYYQDNNKYPAPATTGNASCGNPGNANNTTSWDCDRSPNGVFNTTTSALVTPTAYLTKPLIDPSNTAGNQSVCGTANTTACGYYYYSDGGGNYEMFSVLESPPASGQFFYVNSNGIRGNTNSACTTTFGSGGTPCQ